MAPQYVEGGVPEGVPSLEPLPPRGSSVRGSSVQGSTQSDPISAPPPLPAQDARANPVDPQKTSEGGEGLQSVAVASHRWHLEEEGSLVQRASNPHLLLSPASLEKHGEHKEGVAVSTAVAMEDEEMEEVSEASLSIRTATCSCGTGEPPESSWKPRNSNQEQSVSAISLSFDRVAARERGGDHRATPSSWSLARSYQEAQGTVAWLGVAPAAVTATPQQPAWRDPRTLSRQRPRRPPGQTQRSTVARAPVERTSPPPCPRERAS